MTSSRYRRAIGLRYNPQEGVSSADEVPVVEVKGSDRLADRVVNLAQRYNIPIVEHASLAQSLDLLDLHEGIPERLFLAVAVVLAELNL